MYNPFTGPFSFWGVRHVNGVQATGVERAGQVEERAEETRERELRTKESPNLWTILVPAQSLRNYGLPLTFPLSHLFI